MAAFLGVVFCMILGGFIVHLVRGELLFWKIKYELIPRVESMLSVMEGDRSVHVAVAERVIGEVQDVKRGAQRAAAVAEQARDAAAVAVEKIPEKVVEKLKSGSESVDSDNKIPVVPQTGSSKKGER